MSVDQGYFDGDEDFISQDEEARRDEAGAELGDPRRCRFHPHVATSSPDGLCGLCEAGLEDDPGPWRAPVPPSQVASLRYLDEDDLPF